MTLRIWYCTGMLTDNKYWLRLEEVFTVVGRNVHLQSRAQFQFDRDELGAERERLVVPLLVLPKGALLDDLVVTDDAGNRVGGAVAVRQPFRRRARAARPVLRDAAGGRSRPRAGRLRATRHDLKERIRRFVGLEARRIRIRPTPPGASPTTRACAASGAARRADAVTCRA